MRISSSDSRTRKLCGNGMKGLMGNGKLTPVLFRPEAVQMHHQRTLHGCEIKLLPSPIPMLSKTTRMRKMSIACLNRHQYQIPRIQDLFLAWLEMLPARVFDQELRRAIVAHHLSVSQGHRHLASRWVGYRIHPLACKHNSRLRCLPPTKEEETPTSLRLQSHRHPQGQAQLPRCSPSHDKVRRKVDGNRLITIGIPHLQDLGHLQEAAKILLMHIR